MPSFVVKQGLLAVGLMLCVSVTLAQVITSVKDGKWSSPSTWSGGTVPDASNSTTITIDHVVQIPEDTILSVDNVLVNDELIVQANAWVTIEGDSLQGITLTGAGMLNVFGNIICNNRATLAGTSVLNTTFHNGSLYRDRWHTEGLIPIANWNVNSTFELTGLRPTELSANTSMWTSNWSQLFGNFIYDCPEQGDFMDFRGLLTNVQGDLIIRNTNEGLLRFSRGHALSLFVGGDLIIEGPSEVQFSVSNSNVLVTVGGNFTFQPSSGAPSYFTLEGETTVIVSGDVTINTTPKLKFASGSSNGTSTLQVSGNFNLVKGTIDALETGTGQIVFNGTGVQYFNRSAGTTMEGNLGFLVESESILDLNQSVLSNTTSGDLQIYGTIRLGSLDTNGALQTSGGGNIQIAGAVLIDPEATVEYNGSAPQFIGSGHPSSAHTVLTNEYGVTFVDDVQIADLVVQSGSLSDGGRNVMISGNVSIEASATIQSSGTWLFNGSQQQTITANGNTFQNISIQNESGQDLLLLSPLNLTGILSILSSGSNVVSDGNLRLVSVSEDVGGTARIGPLPTGSGITGDVTVERFMKGIGYKYRYISSPVTSATVADLMDDIPVTGSFTDASTGSGLTSSPSFFFYEESITPARGWVAYPSSGMSSDHVLEPGVGYSLFNWHRSDPFVWDVTGVVTSGPVEFDVSYTDTGNEAADGWNLLGNPYPCDIVWDETFWTLSNVSPWIYIKDNESGEFRFWDGALGTISNGTIAMGQAFWVKANGAGVPTVEVTEAAKITDGGEFYRKRKNVDYVEITLSGMNRSDRTFFRLREGSESGLDKFDVFKRDNDILSVSIRESNQTNLAISAVNKAECIQEIPLAIKVNSSSEQGLRIEAMTFGLFEGSSIMLHDRPLDVWHNLSTSSYEFVTAGGESLDDRFVIRLSSSEPILSGVTVPQYLCNNDTLICLASVSKGIRPELEIQDGIRYPFFEDGDKWLLKVPGVALPADQINVKLLGESFCMSNIALDSFLIERVKVEPPSPTSGSHCMAGVVELLAQSEHVSALLHWYSEEDQINPIATGENFTTPYLQKSSEYFVAAIDPTSGCESVKVPVTAEIIQYDEVSLQQHEGMLVSSYVDGNTWYFNGAKMAGAVDDTLRLSQPGLYEVEVTVGACTSRTGYAHLVTEVTMNGERGIKVFPVPCTDYLFTVGYERGAGQIVDILSPSGVSVAYLCPWSCQGDRCSFYVESLPPGMYFLCFANDNGKHTFTRFIKR